MIPPDLNLSIQFCQFCFIFNPHFPVSQALFLGLISEFMFPQPWHSCRDTRTWPQIADRPGKRKTGDFRSITSSHFRFCFRSWAIFNFVRRKPAKLSRVRFPISTYTCSAAYQKHKKRILTSLTLLQGQLRIHSHFCKSWCLKFYHGKISICSRSLIFIFRLGNQENGAVMNLGLLDRMARALRRVS